MAHRKDAEMAGTAPEPVGKMQCLVLPQWGTPQSWWHLKIEGKLLHKQTSIKITRLHTGFVSKVVLREIL